MEIWHLAWLGSHPERSEGWLRDRLADGFDVHHCDGDRGNNDPGNLILVEAADHTLVLHGLKMVRKFTRGETQRPSGRKKVNAARDVAVYKDRSETFDPWSVVGERHGIGACAALAGAKRAADLNRWKWPLLKPAPVPRAGWVVFRN